MVCMQISPVLDIDKIKKYKHKQASAVFLRTRGKTAFDYLKCLITAMFGNDPHAEKITEKTKHCTFVCDCITIVMTCGYRFDVAVCFC